MLPITKLIEQPAWQLNGQRHRIRELLGQIQIQNYICRQLEDIGMLVMKLKEMKMTKDKQMAVLNKLRKLLGAENRLPEWANAVFVSSKELTIWIDPKAQNYPQIPTDIDGVPIKIRFKGPGQAL